MTLPFQAKQVFVWFFKEKKKKWQEIKFLGDQTCMLVWVNVPEDGLHEEQLVL